MKKAIYNIIIVVFILGFYSCENFLDEKPKQAIASVDAITNLDEAQVALNGCYDGLQEIELFARDIFIIADLAADNSKMNSQNAGRFVNIYQWNIATTEGYGTGIWNESYKRIYRANKLINDVSAFVGVDETEQNRIVGEAKVIRALIYFYLVNYFSQPYNYTDDASHLGVPLILEAVDVNAKPGRASVYEIYQQILIDLEGSDSESGAIDLLGSGNESFYIDINVANALISRVALYMEDWTKARDYALAVINSGDFQLVPSSEYISSWKTDSHSEQIFYLRFDEVDNWSVDMLGQMYMESGYGDILATSDLLDLFDVNDVRNGWFRIAGDLNYIEKYPGRTRVGIDNIPILRLAEMYLNAAEAEAELNNFSNAQTYVNVITSRAGASQILATGDALISQIKLERRKELCFEGQRLWDLQRWNSDILREDLTNPDIKSKIEYPSYLFAYPIPDREIQVNSVIKEQQNPGY